MSEMSPLSRLLCGLAWQQAQRGQQAQARRWQGAPRESVGTQINHTKN